MIGYVTLGTNDLPRAAAFYDAVAGAMGYGRMMQEGEFIAWGSFEDGTAGIAATKPFDGEPATVGNGTMAALMVDGKDKVDEVYKVAMDNGASDEGAPGPRGEPDPNGNVFYAGYFRDLDGNKLNVFTMAPA